jgi:hypothetical protein
MIASSETHSMTDATDPRSPSNRIIYRDIWMFVYAMFVGRGPSFEMVEGTLTAVDDTGRGTNSPAWSCSRMRLVLVNVVRYFAPSHLRKSWHTSLNWTFWTSQLSGFGESEWFQQQVKRKQIGPEM